MNCYLELSVPFVTSGATMFLCFVDLFCFSWISPPPSSLISMALWLQAAHPRVEKTALQCTKKSKLNQKCCSWCLFYTVVLLAFLLLYMMKISKLYQMTWKLTLQTTWNFRLLKKLLSQNLVVLVKLIVDGNWIYSFENISSSMFLAHCDTLKIWA